MRGKAMGVPGMMRGRQTTVSESVTRTVNGAEDWMAVEDLAAEWVAVKQEGCVRGVALRVDYVKDEEQW
jgi:hypothetical protein